MFYKVLRNKRVHKKLLSKLQLGAPTKNVTTLIMTDSLLSGSTRYTGTYLNNNRENNVSCKFYNLQSLQLTWSTLRYVDRHVITEIPVHISIARGDI